VTDANDWFGNRNALRRPPLRQNDFGGVLGGPVLLPHYNAATSRLFVSYEQLELRQPQVVETTVPSRELRARLKPAYQALFNAFPVPQRADNGSGAAPYAASYSILRSSHNGSVRFDQTLPKNTLLFVRYNETPATRSRE